MHSDHGLSVSPRPPSPSYRRSRLTADAPAWSLPIPFLAKVPWGRSRGFGCTEMMQEDVRLSL